MEPVTPFWFKQRQCKAEPAGDNLLKVSGPNLGEAFLRLEQVGGLWKAALRLKADGEDIQATPARFANQTTGWEAAFELYRIQCVI